MDGSGLKLEKIGQLKLEKIGQLKLEKIGQFFQVSMLRDQKILKKFIMASLL